MSEGAARAVTWWAGNVVQSVWSLSRVHEALGLISSTTWDGLCTFYLQSLVLEGSDVQGQPRLEALSVREGGREGLTVEHRGSSFPSDL